MDRVVAAGAGLALSPAPAAVPAAATVTTPAGVPSGAQPQGAGLAPSPVPAAAPAAAPSAASAGVPSGREDGGGSDVLGSTGSDGHGVVAPPWGNAGPQRPMEPFSNEPTASLDPGSKLEEAWTKVASVVSEVVAAPVQDEAVSVKRAEPFVPTNVVRRIINVPCLEGKHKDPQHDCGAQDIT